MTIATSRKYKTRKQTFTDIYYFELDEEGTPKDIEKKEVKFTKLQDVEECLIDWKLKGFARDSNFRVEFTWKHAIGWTQMRVINKDFSQTIVNSEDSCFNDTTQN